ncbi:MAG: 23S rRNA (adenine(2503)-C(2))-methyltransferase RlmN [bacterium]
MNYFLNIETVLADEPKYRIKQVKQAVFCDFVSDWGDIRSLPLQLRERLRKEVPLEIRAQSFISDKKDSIKALITLEDEALIETVLMRHQNGRNTVCVSTQVGCPMGCAFCATGTMGFVRNLTSDEIVIQVLFFARYLKQFDKRVSGVVFMGMGEPFLNYDKVMKAIDLLHDVEGLNIGARRFSISTCGILEGIKKLAKEPLDINLAISLHASNDEIRRRLMPIAKTQTIQELLKYVDDYITMTNRRVMFEYVMIAGINDTDEHARQLVALMKKPLYVVNLISYNATGEFKASSQDWIQRFKEILDKNSVRVTIRHRFGRDIKGACGQLVTDQCIR